MIVLQNQTNYFQENIMFLYVLLIPLVSAITVSPVNISCIWGASYKLQPMNQSILGREYYLPTITLLPFSYAEIWFDFRSISLDETNFKVQIQIGETVQKLSNYTNRATKYSLFVSKEYDMTITISLNNEYDMFKYLLINTTTVNVTLSQPRFSDKYSGFMWVVKANDNINLPFNFPNIRNFEGYFLNKITDNEESSLQMTTPIKGTNYYSENVEYWSTYSSFTVPYIPYISNCETVGGNIYLTRQLEDPNNCNLIPINQTKPINSFVFGSSATGDECSHEISCMYDESITMRHEYPYWQTLAADGVLMYITHQEVDSSSYKIAQQWNDEDLVDCKIDASDGDNSTDKLPTEIQITLGYYQQSQTHKRMISCDIQYSLFTTPSDNFTYTLKIISKPLNHTSILIAFGFSFYVYMLAFLIIGFASSAENFILGIYHWIANKQTRKFIKIKVYLPILFQVLKGCVLAALPMLVVGGLICVLMGGYFFNIDLSHFSNSDSSGPKVIWDLITSVQISDYSSNLANSNRSGRLGIAFVVVGLYIILFSVDKFIGMERKKQQLQVQEMYGEMINPHLWAKCKFLFGTAIYLCLQLLLLYFAFSNFYGDNIWVFIGLTKVLMMILEEVIDIIFVNIIASMPLKIISNLTSYLNTLAANNFYQFMFSFLIDLAIEMAEKAYLATIQNITANYLDVKLKQFSIFLDKFLHDGQKQESVIESELMSEDSSDHQIEIALGPNDVSFEEQMSYDMRSLNSEDDYQHDDIQKVYKQLLIQAKQSKFKQIVQIVQWNDEDQQEQKRNDLLEMVVDVFSVPVNVILQPFAIVILWMTYNDTNTLSSFKITWEITPTYIFSNFTLGPFTIINAILTLFMLENFHHFEMEEFVTSNMERYYNRNNYWKSDDDEIETNCQVKVRGVVKFCISSQLFFLVMIYTIAMEFVLVGIQTMVYNQYDPFDDFGSLLVILVWLTMTHFFTKAAIWFGTKVLDLWDYKQFHSTEVCPIDEQCELSHVKLAGTFKDMNDSQNRTGINYNEIEINQSEILDSIQEKQKENNFELTKAKIASICNSFKPVFEDENKKMEYSMKNKQFLIQNIDRILNSVKLQELPEDVRNYETVIKQTLKKPTIRINLNEVKMGEYILRRWLQEAKSSKSQAKSKAIDREKEIKKCSYCFNNWGIYTGYGDGSICLECNEEFIKLKEE